jgi:hypothetical protein
MEEHVPDRRNPASKNKSRFSRILERLVRLSRGNQRGQAITEYMLVMILAFTFAHQVFFNPKFGFASLLKTTMLRIGSFVEQNLKSGTKVGGSDGKLSLDPYAGTDRWSN